MTTPAPATETTPQADAPKTAYKVLMEGKSFHGGHHKWSLPEGDKPGDWHVLPYGPALCEVGFHLTQRPAVWFAPGAKVYVAEYGGAVSGPRTGEPDNTKIAVEKVRLLRELTPAELAQVGIFTEGTHEFSGPVGHASGSAKVTAEGSATVTASDSATVTAYGSAKVTAEGSATVTAEGSATVTAYGSATVTAYGSAKVTAEGTTTTITTRWFSGVVKLIGLAVEVSWKSGRAEFRRADPDPVKPEAAPCSAG